MQRLTSIEVLGGLGGAALIGEQGQGARVRIFFTAIKAFLQGNGGRANWGDVRKGINSSDRDFFGDAVAALVAAGEVTVEKKDRAKVLVLVEGRR